MGNECDCMLCRLEEMRDVALMDHRYGDVETVEDAIETLLDGPKLAEGLHSDYINALEMIISYAAAGYTESAVAHVNLKRNVH